MSATDPASQDLTRAETHFAFGRNWASYAEGINETSIADAVTALTRLLGRDTLAGARFLDIGCGSGLHSLAALRLGASEIVAVDIDADSVATTTRVLSTFAPDARVRVERRSIFDIEPSTFGLFDVVYSWGVLHHTGDMNRAIQRAAALLAPRGSFLFALYRRSWCCELWKVEKRWYTHASPRRQRIARNLYVGWYRLLTSAASVARRLRGHASQSADRRYRGMDFEHDVHDWLGGYPYESILPDDVEALMAAAGLERDAEFLCQPDRRRSRGLLGSGCDEYRFVRPTRTT